MIQLRLKHHQTQALKAALWTAIRDTNESILGSIESHWNKINQKRKIVKHGCNPHVKRMRAMIVRWRFLLLDVEGTEAAKGATG